MSSYVNIVVELCKNEEKNKDHTLTRLINHNNSSTILNGLSNELKINARIAHLLCSIKNNCSAVQIEIASYASRFNKKRVEEGAAAVAKEKNKDRQITMTMTACIMDFAIFGRQPPPPTVRNRPLRPKKIAKTQFVSSFSTARPTVWIAIMQI